MIDIIGDVRLRGHLSLIIAVVENVAQASPRRASMRGLALPRETTHEYV